MDVRVTLLILLEALFALYLLYRSGCVKTSVQWSAVVTLLLVAFVPRLLALKYETLDYPDNMEALMRYRIVERDLPDAAFTPSAVRTAGRNS